MQMPISRLWGDEIITGVPVTLTAIGSDSSYVDIGVVTTDGYSGTFDLAWTPTKEGTYKVIASFEGDASYGSSSATTYVTVGPAASASTPVEPEIPVTPVTPETPLITTEVAIIAAVAIASIIGAVSFLALRKRK